jgi:UrcA family protein
MEIIMSFRTASLAAAALLTFTVSAAQADMATPVTTDVAYGDLNLAHAEDAKILAGRLQVAAQQVCLSANPGLAGKSDLQQCVDIAINMAMARIVSRLDQSVRVNLASVSQPIATP